MRKIGLLATGAAIMLLGVVLVDVQSGEKQPDKKKGGGFGGGGFNQGGNSPYNLFNRKDVKAELDITDEQVEKLPAEVLVAISKVLTAKQFNRFKQIELQQRGTNAFKDADVQKALKLSGEQKTSINEAIEAMNKEVAEARKDGGGFGKGGNEKVTAARKEGKEKIMAVLNKDQRSTWETMIGDEFKFQNPTFGGGGFGKKKDTKKETDK